jgi:hypothetical protein
MNDAHFTDTGASVPAVHDGGASVLSSALIVPGLRLPCAHDGAAATPPQGTGEGCRCGGRGTRVRGDRVPELGDLLPAGVAAPVLSRRWRGLRSTEARFPPRGRAQLAPAARLALRGEPNVYEPPELAIYCSECAKREFSDQVEPDPGDPMASWDVLTARFPEKSGGLGTRPESPVRPKPEKSGSTADPGSGRCGSASR